jgi:hypothetical protein
VRRSTPLRRGKGLVRGSALRRSRRLRRRTPLRCSAVSLASPAQRAKVAGRACLVCGGRPVDAAHLVPRSLGGCDEPECVVPLDRRCHRAYDRGELDLLPYLEPRCRAELAHGLLHLGLLGLLGRVSGTRWVAKEGGQPREHARGSDGEEG